MAFEPLFPTANDFSWGVGIGSILETDYEKPNATNFNEQPYPQINEPTDPNNPSYRPINQSTNQPPDQATNQ